MIISWEITSCVIFILGVMSASKSFFDAMHVELGTLFSVVRQIAENLAHANIGGCNRAMYSGELCIHHQPIKAEKRKSDRCRGFGRVLGVEERVRLDSAVCAMESQRQ